ncbi:MULTISPECIES: hypothetical protein [Trichocoleus]|uniref:Uncharacterized protein n=1 Tax=Trichocoleus desertorum GB2-A4 TaxID=2933944 RepID=A0ABV0J986_9CYAN|nr:MULTISPECIES: hypothetical protein [unclassified Trichocoleus]MBD1864712.1 hypothetical protein [Trichocoleus sp. FACHB-46]MBD2120388.1 hypothetical protein [Trichocoleus sp. FACHB-262]
MMTPKMMRQLWSLVDTTQVSTLLQFDDSALAQLLLKQLTAEQPIDAQTARSLNTYIQAKLPLIRDTAESRLCAR